jgi:hypothetical protein
MIFKSSFVIISTIIATLSTIVVILSKAKDLLLFLQLFSRTRSLECWTNFANGRSP